MPAGDDAFDLNIGGVRVGRLALDIERNGPRYRTRARFATAGPLATFWDAKLDATAEGQVRGSLWQASRFEAKTAAGAKRQDLEIRWRGSTPDRVTADPPFDPKPWEIDPREQDGTSDPLSAFVSTLRVAEDTAPCGQTAQIFDGRRRYQVTLGPAQPSGTQGRARSCPALFERLAGYKPKQMAKPPVRLNVLYAAREDGGWRLHRVTTSTPFGTAVLVRARRR